MAVKKLLAIVTLLLASLGGMAFAEEPVKDQDVWNDPKNISGSVWLTTDYMFRGISNTDENPAAQGSLDYTFNTDFRASFNRHNNIRFST